MAVAMSGSDFDFLYDMARKQMVTVLRCRLVRGELKEVLPVLEGTELQPFVLGLYRELENLQKLLLRMEVIPGIGKECSTLPRNLESTGEANQDRRCLQIVLADLENSTAQVNPLAVLRGKKKESQSSAENLRMREVFQHWLEFAEVMFELHGIQQRLRELLPNVQRVREIRKLLDDRPQERENAKELQLQALQQHIAKTVNSLRKLGSNRLGDRRVNAWIQFARDTLGYVNESLQPFVVIQPQYGMVERQSVHLDLVIPDLLCERAGLLNPTWIPRVVADEILSCHERYAMLAALQRGIELVGWELIAKDEARTRFEFARIFSAAYDHSLGDDRANLPFEERSPWALHWFKDTLKRILGNNCRIEILTHKDSERIIEIDAASGEDGLKCVAANQVAETTQLGVAVKLRDGSLKWLLPFRGQVPEPWPFLEIKLATMVDHSSRLPATVCSLCDNLNRQLRRHPRGHLSLKQWIETLDCDTRKIIEGLVHHLQRELLIATLKIERQDIAADVTSLLELLEAEGFRVEFCHPQPLGNGKWVIVQDQAVSGKSGRAIDSQTIVGISYEQASDAAQQQNSTKETVVLLEAKTPLHKFLIESQSSVQIIRDSSSDWPGWKIYDAMLLSLEMDKLVDNQSSECETAFDWLETIWRLGDRELPEVRKLLYKHGERLVAVLGASCSIDIVPKKSHSGTTWDAIQTAERQFIDFDWVDSDADHGAILGCEEFARINKTQGIVLRRGKIIVSRGKSFPSSLKSALKLCENVDETVGVTDSNPLKSFFDNVRDYVWKPAQFEAFCRVVKQKTHDYFEDTPEGQAWFNDWMHFLLDNEAAVGWFEWFRENDWFLCIPAIDTSKRIAYWPENYPSGWRFVTVEASEEPVGRICDPVDTVFGVEGYRVKTTISGGQELTENVKQAAALQAVVLDFSKIDGFFVVGRPMMKWVSELRDPIGGRESKRQDAATILEVLDGLSQFAVSGDLKAADGCLTVLNEIAKGVGYAIEPVGWSFANGLPADAVVSENQVSISFSDLPARADRLKNFGLRRLDDSKEGKFLRDFEVERSAGPSPDGYDELLALSSAISSQSGLFPREVFQVVKDIERLLMRLPAAVTETDTNDPVYFIVDLWQQSMENLLPFLLTTSPASAGDGKNSEHQLAARWRAAMQSLATSFQLSSYGQAGTRINEFRENFEEWFDYDPLQLSRASEQAVGAVPQIKTVVCPGLIRNGSSTPLLKARIQF